LSLTHEVLLESIPAHLRQYVVEQNYERYTPRDQAVWRYIMRKNLNFLSRHAHPAYISGLRQTGISPEKIPDVLEMNRVMKNIGWSAVVVNGFIPPAAFMEFQANRILVISAEMRTIEHILYTPAPDIVHEAAGHAPIIADEAYAEYLQRFGEYGSRAIASKLDFNVYEAIRRLSIIKEYPYATEKEIQTAEQKLNDIIAKNTIPSEATKLSRLHWWTVEYGLVGSPSEFKLYGAGLLSSVGESQKCLESEVKKVPLDVTCVETDYDITQMQPQLFVAEDWSHLVQVLEEYADNMCFRRGGTESLRQAIESENVATAVLSSGIQISGVFVNMLTDTAGIPVYLQTRGKTALACADKELEGHDTDTHNDGFGSPVGKLVGKQKPFELWSDQELNEYGIKMDQKTALTFQSGITVTGRVKKIERCNTRIILISFIDCLVRDQKGSILFQPQWGRYDMAVGAEITSVFAGSADKQKFNVLPAKSEAIAIDVHYDEQTNTLFKLYDDVRKYRQKEHKTGAEMEAVYRQLCSDFNNEWLIRLELLELTAQSRNDEELGKKLRSDLKRLVDTSSEFNQLIKDGIDLLTHT